MICDICPRRDSLFLSKNTSKVILPKLGTDFKFVILVGIQGKLSPGDSKKGPSVYIWYKINGGTILRVWLSIYPTISGLYDRRWRGTRWSREVTNAASHAFVSRLQSAHKADCRRRGGLSKYGTSSKVGLSDITDCPFEEKDPKKEGAIWPVNFIVVALSFLLPSWTTQCLQN